ncbi:zinc finger protein 667-like [Euwallacea similis]|uniref:zinc finger protein 667-like n=1 Tax=Euwallacea similis TaxID=1736056 RepID=UPI00344CB137
MDGQYSHDSSVDRPMADRLYRQSESYNAITRMMSSHSANKEQAAADAVAEYHVGKFMCFCGKSYSAQTNLRRHQREHGDKSNYHLCKICSYTTYRRDVMKIHMLRNHEKHYKKLCQFVELNVNFQNFLKEWKNFHLYLRNLRDKKKNCKNFADWRSAHNFSEFFTLKSFVDVSRKSRNFKFFETLENLLRILQIFPHLEEFSRGLTNPANGFHYLSVLAHCIHTCSQCDKAYKHLATLKRHAKYECNKKPSFKCPYCAYACKQKYTLVGHVLQGFPPYSFTGIPLGPIGIWTVTKQSTGASIVVTNLAENGTWENTLNPNIRWCLIKFKRFHCSCGRSYKNPESLCRHRRECGTEKQLQCPHCSYKSHRNDNLRRHMLTHFEKLGKVFS